MLNPPAIAILGLGLIGGSLARSLQKKQLASTIAAYDPDTKALQQALKDGAIHNAANTVAEAVNDAHIIFIACPPDKLENVFEQALPHLRRGAIVTDVLSVKSPVAALAIQHPNIHIIPAHPIAGAAQSGYGASTDNLFDSRRVILTPNDDTDLDRLETIENLWQGLGAVTEHMDASNHDRIYAMTSHLPQLLAYAAAQTMGKQAISSEWQRFLRISHSPTGLWRAIALANQAYLAPALETYLAVLRHMIHELAQGPQESVVMDSSESMAMFPRIAASCLISTVTLAERQGGTPVARYAGNGFRDFISPAETPPEGDIETISNQFAALISPLQQYAHVLDAMLAALQDQDGAVLEESFTAAPLKSISPVPKAASN